jgi:site-specific DNA recombinase
VKPSIAKKKATRQVSPALTDTRIALYLRVSSDEQTHRKTIEAQRDFLHNWARLYDFPIAGVYEDDGVSGTIPLPERPDGARLLQDAQAGGFGAVVVYRVDRLARSLRVLMDGHTALEDAGVAIKSATEPFDSSTPIGKFLFQLLGSMAELERSTIIERMNLGRDRVTRHGRWLMGPFRSGIPWTPQTVSCPVRAWSNRSA